MFVSTKAFQGYLLTLTSITMEKFPFSNVGFQNLQEQLYRLSDSLLEIQANFILMNFKKWMTESFILSNEQIAFIESQDEKMIKFLASQTSIAISNRLPITLVKPAVNNRKQQLDSKLIRPESNFRTLFNDDGKTEIYGNLTIHISYVAKKYPDTLSNVFRKHNQQYLN
jgi:hypothetical protein